MRIPVAARVMALVLAWAAPSTASAQSPVLLMGRIEDALSAEPVAGVRVTAGDASRAVFTNALGHFAIQVPGPAPFVVSAVRDGYEPATFELPLSAVSEVATLVLEPALLLAGFLAPEDRIRVASPEVTGEFWVTRVRPDALVLRDPASATLEVPTSSLAGLEVSRGRQTSWTEGFFGGAFGGGLVGGALGLQCNQPHYGCVTGMSLRTSTVVGAGIGVLVGLIMARSSDEVWEEVRLPGSPSEDRVADDWLATQPARVRDNEDLGEDVELRVRNQTPDPLTAYVVWEGGGPIPLGEVGAGSTRSFRSPLRSSGLALFVEMRSDPGVSQPSDMRRLVEVQSDPVVSRRSDMRRPSRFILVTAGDRLEWTVLGTTSGFVEDYFRITDR